MRGGDEHDPAGPSTTVFERIRHACREVARRARFVWIDEEGLEALASRLAQEPWPEEDLDPAHHLRGEESGKLAFVIALDAINFGSGWFPVLRKQGGLSGYRTVATACRRHFEAEGAWSAARLRETTTGAMATLLGQDTSDPEVEELMALYARAWRDLGEWLGARHGDRFESVVESARHSAARLVEALVEMPLYRDVSRYDELEVPFYKRAQITVADLHRAFGSGPLGRFDDLDELTLFADNLVPHVLRCEGVLDLDPELASRIDREELLEVGSAPEVEIRAVAVEAVERLVASLGRRGRPTTAAVLDGLLWNAGQAPRVKARPRHRARCVYY
ncbi:MAG: hypothetical protein JRF61_14570 [Deltaproteobacteria bacterium]|jgi:hypothetical protein|nr:hypothetical protein [Deltaproteobacteria bacterium]